MKRFLILFITLLSLLQAEEIKRYDIEVSLSKEGILTIEENILYDFGDSPHHGIYRDIPHLIKTDFLPKKIGLKVLEVLLDGKKVKWEKTFVNTSAQEALRIKIGDPEKFIKGVHRYTIRYRIERAVLPKNDRTDMINLNAVGVGWSVPIKRVSIRFKLPAPLSENNAEFLIFTGVYGSKSSKAEKKWLNERTFEIEVKELNPHEGVTIEVLFPKGALLQNSKDNIKTSLSEYAEAFWGWGAIGAFLFFLYSFTKKHSTLYKKSVPVYYKPPEKMDVLQAGLIYDKFADTKDFSAAVVELAQKGYLEIYPEKSVAVLKKIPKDSSNLSEDERYLLNEILFPNDSEIYVLNTKDPSDISKLKKGFEKINDMLYEWSVKEGYLRENPKKQRISFLLKSVPVFVLILIAVSYTSGKIIGYEKLYASLFISIFIAAGLFIFTKTKDYGGKIFAALFIVFSFITVLPVTDIKSLLLSPLPLIILGAIGIYLSYKNIGEFTPKGVKAYIQLKGFKEFMKRVKEDEIRRRLKEDPLYLEKTLPFAMLFGLSKHWLSFYKILSVAAPSWYYGDFYDFERFSHDVLDKSALNADTSSYGETGGSGDFSGGGVGGGGGGSW